MKAIRTKKHERINEGKILSIDGPVIGIGGLYGQKVGDIIKLGHKNMVGEVIKILGKITIAQCYDNTLGLKINEPVLNTNQPLSMELGPGILNKIFDGIQRPLDSMFKEYGSFIPIGASIPALNKEKKWAFNPSKKEGDFVKSGDIIGSVQETEYFEHKIMVPFGNEGIINYIEEGNFSVNEIIYSLKNKSEVKYFNMIQYWPIKKPRPYLSRVIGKEPLITGMRVVDLLYPIPKGGAVAVPGGFGTGKTVIQHNLAKWSHADLIVYVGCGERGNEMADILDQFPNLTDPRTGLPIMQRTVLIGNTSNMPVSAREASIFSGLTIAEYLRDQGNSIALLADSTSRWAEALKEISGRLEEMPAEGGYPAYLPTRLANFYERAGYVTPYGSPTRKGSITIIGAVSPPSGDFSEPVTNSTKRFVSAFWALDAKLAYSRHYPAIRWTNSYSLYGDQLESWWDKQGLNWGTSRNEINQILTKSDQLQNVVQLVGKDSLPREQQFLLFTSDLIKDSFLIQNAFDTVDRYCAPKKTLAIANIILKYYNKGLNSINTTKTTLKNIQNLNCVHKIKRFRYDITNDDIDSMIKLEKEIDQEFEDILKRN